MLKRFLRVIFVEFWCDCFFYIKFCLEIFSWFWSVFVVNFKFFLIILSCCLVLFVLKVGGGLFLVMGCVMWVDKGFFLFFIFVFFNVVEFFMVEVMIRIKLILLNMCYLGLFSFNNFGCCMEIKCRKRYCNGCLVSYFCFWMLKLLNFFVDLILSLLLEFVKVG